MDGYTIISLDDAENVFEKHGYPGEMRFLTKALGNEQTAITYRKMPKNSGGKGSYGHYHHTQEEVIYLISGELEVKLNDEVKILKAKQVIRIAPETVRSLWNAQDEPAELLIMSTKLVEGVEDTDKVPDFWPE